MEFLIHNGKILSKQEVNLNELVFQNLFSFSQKMWFGFGGIPLLNENIKSLEEQLATFQRKLPELFKNQRELFRLSKRMLNKNRFYLSGWINIQLFISESNIDFLLTATSSKEPQFPINTKGLLAEISTINKASNNPHNLYQAHNSALWHSVDTIEKDSKSDVLIILNDKQSVCESSFSNLFMIREDILFTPALSTGCFKDVLRKQVLEVASNIELQIAEVEDMKVEHLLQMDEVFLASEGKGMNWILGIRDKRYIHKFGIEIHQQINNLLKNQIS